MVQVPGLVRRPGQQPGELPAGPAKRRRQLPVHRDLAPVLPDPPYRHREPRRHRRASDAFQVWFPADDPGNGPGTSGPGIVEPSPDPPAANRWTLPLTCTISPPVMPDTSGKPGHSAYQGIQSDISARSRLLKRCTRPKVFIIRPDTYDIRGQAEIPHYIACYHYATILDTQASHSHLVGKKESIVLCSDGRETDCKIAFLRKVEKPPISSIGSPDVACSSSTQAPRIFGEIIALEVDNVDPFAFAVRLVKLLDDRLPHQAQRWLEGLARLAAHAKHCAYR